MFLGMIVTRMFLLLPIFCRYFFLIYLFVTAKAALPKIVLKKLPGLEAKRQTNKQTYRYYKVVMNSYPDERNSSVILIESTKLL